MLDQVSPNPTEVFCDYARGTLTKIGATTSFLVGYSFMYQWYIVAIDHVIYCCITADKWRVTVKGDPSSYIHASFANVRKKKIECMLS